MRESLPKEKLLPLMDYVYSDYFVSSYKKFTTNKKPQAWAPGVTGQKICVAIYNSLLGPQARDTKVRSRSEMKCCIEVNLRFTMYILMPPLCIRSGKYIYVFLKKWYQSDNDGLDACFQRITRVRSSVDHRSLDIEFCTSDSFLMLSIFSVETFKCWYNVVFTFGC